MFFKVSTNRSHSVILTAVWPMSQEATRPKRQTVFPTTTRDTGSNLFFKQGIRPHSSYYSSLQHSVSSLFWLLLPKEVLELINRTLEQKNSVRYLPSSALLLHVRCLNITTFHFISLQPILTAFWVWKNIREAEDTFLVSHCSGWTPRAGSFGL